ncbi:MAG: branched-chain amino acid transaminase [Lacibacter sp.]|jgi:branched-chain amino acid aminotransferase
MTTYYNNNTILYHDGRCVRAVDACMDFYSQSLHYGYSVFEGIRSYRQADGTTRIFKAKEHYERLQASAAALHLPYTWTVDALIEVTYELLRQNQLQDAYIRPLVYAPANMTFQQNDIAHLVIAVWPMQPFLGERLLRVMTSSYRRPNPEAFHIEAKASGHYVNSILASQQAKANGYDEALLLDVQGYVAEGPGANLFFEKDGVLFTPAAGNILPGITRATVLELCAINNIEVKEVRAGLDEVKQADAAFYCGTAAEIVGFERLDDYVFPKPWSETISAQLQQAYKQLVSGNSRGIFRQESTIVNETSTIA